MPGLSLWLTGQHPINNFKCFPLRLVLYAICMSIMAPITLLIIPGRRDPSPLRSISGFHPCLLRSSFLPSGWLGFETAPVFKGYTNTIQFIEMNTDV